MHKKTINPNTTLMFKEAEEANQAVAHQIANNKEIVKQIAEKYSNNLPELIVTCARGSSDHAATFGKYVFETRLGILTSSLAPSVSSIYKKELSIKNALCIAISQSGKSPDLLSVMNSSKEQGLATLALVNDTDSPLASLCDDTFPLCAGPEKSVAATKSFIASLTGVLEIGQALNPDAFKDTDIASIPALLKQSFECDWTPLLEALKDAEGLYTIGRGPALGIANEAALKFQETCGLHAQAYSSAEVRHGPMALVKEDFPVIVFYQDDESAPSVKESILELAKYSKKIFVIGTEIEGTHTLPSIKSSALITPILQIQSLYKMINSLSIARGYDPDRPVSLKKVTETI